MQIAGLNKFSTTDYPGKMSCIIYTAACNFNCWWCPHPEYIAPEASEVIPEEEVMEFLNKRHGMVEAVVLSGGEPTLQPDLGTFIRTCRHIGYDVKLRTNGSNPRVIETLLSERLLNCAEVDFKAPSNKYREFCAFHGEAVLETIEAMRRARLDFALRTVVRPDLSVQDMEEMVREAGPVPRWNLRPYNPSEGADPADVKRSRELLRKMETVLISAPLR